MINFYRNEEIDMEKWDYCIKNSINSYIYGYSWYLNAVAENWDALIEDDYKSVFPLPYKKKIGVKYIYQTVFVQQLGLFTTLSLDAERLNKFIQSIPKEFSYIDLNLNKFIIPEIENHTVTIRQNIELNLQRSYGEIEKFYSENLRRNLKKARKSKLKIFDSVDPDTLITLFAQNKGKLGAYYSTADYQKLKHLLHILLHKNLVRIQGVYSPENNLVAAAAFLISEQRLIFLFSGLSEEGKRVAAMHYLIDNCIKQNSSQSITFDFEGSDNENLARFYLSFGSQKFEYYSLKINNLNMVVSLIFSIYKRLKG